MDVGGEEVKALRQRMGWSTYDLAGHVGCNQSTIWRIEEKGLKVRGAITKTLRDLIAKHPPQDEAPAAKAA